MPVPLFRSLFCVVTGTCPSVPWGAKGHVSPCTLWVPAHRVSLSDWLLGVLGVLDYVTPGSECTVSWVSMISNVRFGVYRSGPNLILKLTDRGYQVLLPGTGLILPSPL